MSSYSPSSAYYTGYYPGTSGVGNLTSYGVYANPDSILGLIGGPPISNNITQAQAFNDVENAESFLPPDSADALQFQVDIDQEMQPYFGNNPNPYSSLLNEITPLASQPTEEDVANEATGGNLTNPLTVELSGIQNSSTINPNLLSLSNPFANLIVSGSEYPSTGANYSYPATDYGYPSSSYGYSSEYPSSSYGYSFEYPSSSYGYSSEYPSSSYGYSSEYPSSSYGYSSEYPSSSYGYSSEYPSSSYGYSSGYTSSPYGYSSTSSTQTGSAANLEEQMLMESMMMNDQSMMANSGTGDGGGGTSSLMMEQELENEEALGASGSSAYNPLSIILMQNMLNNNNLVSNPFGNYSASGGVSASSYDGDGSY